MKIDPLEESDTDDRQHGVMRRCLTVLSCDLRAETALAVREKTGGDDGLLAPWRPDAGCGLESVHVLERRGERGATLRAGRGDGSPGRAAEVTCQVRHHSVYSARACTVVSTAAVDDVGAVTNTAELICYRKCRVVILVDVFVVISRA